MPKAAFDAFVQQDLAFKLKLPTGSMTLNKAAASSIAGQMELFQGINLNMELLPIELEALTITQQAFVKPDDVIVDINIGTGDQKFSSFGDGQLEVQISYTGDLPVAVWYLSDEGELQKIQNATYSEETGLVTFHLDHLSLYVLGKDTEAGGGSGVTLTGKIKSYNPGASLTVKLMQDDVEKYSKTLDAGSGSGQIEQDFSIGGVAAGTYKLVVEKASHLKYTVSGVEVGTSDLNLTAAAEDKPYKTITLLCGDLNGDGFINDDDLNTVWKPANYLKTPGADGVDSSTDLNGDGKINDEDLNIVWNPSVYLKGISNCTFNY